MHVPELDSSSKFNLSSHFNSVFPANSLVISSSVHLEEKWSLIVAQLDIEVFWTGSKSIQREPAIKGEEQQNCVKRWKRSSLSFKGVTAFSLNWIQLDKVSWATIQVLLLFLLTNWTTVDIWAQRRELNFNWTFLVLCSPSMLSLFCDLVTI